ncbi:TolB family protein [Desulfonatronovibrio hydrogenovorans]|uniref:TolB family protein n=1 Tax=Desulfonatronovibrio hydrogenovorans TaxID=53245 RepID=UPI0006909E05|nr:TolB family protein [Desulfonatronovibrio hydrogenovorans]
MKQKPIKKLILGQGPGRCLFLIILGLFLLTPGPAMAESLKIDIFGPGQDRMNIFVAPARSLDQADFTDKEVPEQIRSLLVDNLALLPFLRNTRDGEILGGPGVDGIRGADIDFRKFSLSRVDLLLTIGVDQRAGLPGSVEIRAFEVFGQRMVLGKAYTLFAKDQVPLMVRRFCAELMEYLTGHGDFFRSILAFERKQGDVKEIWSVNPLGQDLEQLTSLGSIALSPDWSQDGEKIAFTLLQDNQHSLGVWSRASRQVQIYSLPGNTVISPAFSPNGRLAVSIDPMGRPDIYWLDGNFRMDRSIMEHWAIDVSPSFDQAGRKMAFASGRLGNPHIFVLDLESNRVQRITYEGRYNTNPSISPDGRHIAFTRQTPDGHRIFLANLETGRERQISFGPGNDEDPGFAPDGYFIAFSSNRDGKYRLYLTTRNADSPVLIPTGDGHATSPAWGPEPGF